MQAISLALVFVYLAAAHVLLGVYDTSTFILREVLVTARTFAEASRHDCEFASGGGQAAGMRQSQLGVQLQAGNGDL